MRALTQAAVLSFVLSLPLLVGCEQPAPDSSEVSSVEGASKSALFKSATLKSAAGATVARVVFTKFGHGVRVLVTATINFPGIRAGFHGMHIHANDNAANGVGCVADPAQPANTHFVSADGHWNPTAVTHGAHAGDMPSPLVLADGSALLSFTNDIDLGAADFVGRAIILHEGLDNFGNIPLTPAGGDPAAFPNAYTPNSAAALTLTQNTGNAGNRIGCGLIQ
jgi:Cu-Zn family superoxide dismutase